MMHWGLAALCLGTSAWASAAAPVHLTLEDSIRTALEKASAVRKSANNAELAGAQALQGYAQFLPNLNTALDYTYNSGTQLYTINGVNLVNSKYLGADFTISSTLNLFNGLSDLSALKSALNKRDSADLSFSFVRQQIALDVTQSYLQVILDGEIVVIAEHNLQASRARLKLLQSQTAVGQTSLADLQRQQAQTSADEQYLTASEVRARNDRLLLIRKIELDPAVDYELAVPNLMPAPTLQLATQAESEVIDKALLARLDLKAEDSLLEGTIWDVTNAKAPYYPRLDLIFSRAAEGRHLQTQFLNGVDVLPPSQSGLIPQLGNQVEYTIGLYLSWNIFDRLLTRTGVVRARIVEDNTRIDREDFRLKIVSDVRQARGDYASARTTLQSAQVGVLAAKKAYDTIFGRYEVGASSFIDVLAAQSALVQAQASLAQAQINLKLQERTLTFVAGDNLL
jgi:outer membrane protein